MIRAATEMIIIGCLAVLVGLIINAFSPVGIPLFGQWNPTIGSVHAGGRCKPSIQESTEDAVAKYYVDPEYLFVDARSSSDYQEGHIPRAVSLPAGEFEDRIDEFLSIYPPTTKLVVYCSSTECHDADELAKQLKEMGYQDIILYAKGLAGWVEMNRPVKAGVDP